MEVQRRDLIPFTQSRGASGRCVATSVHKVVEFCCSNVRAMYLVRLHGSKLMTLVVFRQASETSGRWQGRRGL